MSSKTQSLSKKILFRALPKRRDLVSKVYTLRPTYAPPNEESYLKKMFENHPS